MDPKMDSGYLAPGETLDDDYDVSRHLLPEEVVGIMDQLLCHEAAWHMGHSIAQTIFTSIYIDRILWPVPRTLESARFDRPVKGRHTGYPSVADLNINNSNSSTGSQLVSLVLRAYCLSLLKACDRVHNRITLEYFFEEEDFVSQLFNRKLLSDIHTAEIIALLDEALSWLERQKPSDEGLRQPLIDALTSRLLFRRNFLIALDEDLNVLKSRDTSCFEESRQHLDEILRSVSDEKKRETISKPVPESFSTKFQRRLASTVPPKPIVDTISMETAVCFLKQLCTDAIDVVELVRGYEGPETLFTATNVFMSRKRPGHKQGIAQLGREPSVYVRCLGQAFLLHASSYWFGTEQRNLPASQHIIGGSSNIQVADGIPLKKFVCDSLAELVLPHSRNRSLGPNILALLDPENSKVEHPEDPRFKIAAIVDGFIERFSPTFVDMYRSLCLNRCRVRRFMTHTVVDWDVIQSEAEEIDTQLQQLTKEPGISLYPSAPGGIGGQLTYSFPLSSWVYHHKLRLMRQITQMGLELEVYAVEELAGVYYHLSQLCASHLTHIDRIRVCVMHQQRKWQNAHKSRSSNNEVEKRASTEFSRTLTRLDRFSMELIAVDAFAIAMHALYVILDRFGLLEPLKSVPRARKTTGTKRQYSNAALKYELRMKPFLPITIPEVMPFDAFMRGSTMEGDSNESILARATCAISEAKRGLEKYIGHGMSLDGEDNTSSAIYKDWVADSKDSLRACIGASLAINQINKAVDQAAKRTSSSQTTKDLRQETSLPLQVAIPSVDDKARWHPWWAIPQITPVTSKDNAPLP
ncbi:Mak10 subunit, NatC N(alpha)-terminal acetyltransferase [Ascosphaera apis ARSEF 7405]|uniref:Mak10 subunit, NatC N(Alpha)-terminal acetyltransferase n=1 Tax=Ascosphaera apis ARSEF 7405 TaxID=392613 RepID=A0A167VMY9_9EURO|nr:Mak10 subunit, NatC N(alpha)-terminal acetyltransferase [Ascosphaera apis ARSEF 7405]